MKTGVKIGLGIAAVAAAFLAWNKMRKGTRKLPVFESTSGKILSVQPDQLPPDFSEAGYRAINTDVDAAIKNGSLTNAASHYLTIGWQEGRAWKTGMGGGMSYLLR